MNYVNIDTNNKTKIVATKQVVENLRTNEAIRNFLISSVSEIFKDKEILKKQSQPNELFQPLHNDNSRLINISEGKAKYNWLRIYAVKIDENRFLIVGGAIKLTFKMDAHKSTQDELKKIAYIKNILIENNIIDGDSFDDALYEINL